jgi:hypothetical protein
MIALSEKAHSPLKPTDPVIRNEVHCKKAAEKTIKNLGIKVHPNLHTTKPTKNYQS